MSRLDKLDRWLDRWWVNLDRHREDPAKIIFNIELFKFGAWLTQSEIWANEDDRQTDVDT